MSEHLIAARAALADEIADAQARIDRARTALEVLGADTPVPLVRPPADDVPAPPVELPKPPKREQRPAAARTGQRKRKYDYDEIAGIARQAHAAGRSMRDALVAHLDIPIKQVDTLLWKLRKGGYDIPRSSAFTTEPITRTPVNEQAARDAAAGPSQGPAQPITIRPIGQPPFVHPERAVKFGVEQALGVIEAAS